MSLITRRFFIERAGIGALAMGFGNKSKSKVTSQAGSKKLQPTSTTTRYAIEKHFMEWTYSSGKAYADPWNDVEVEVVFADPQGHEQRVPAFWSGEQDWKIRYAPPAPGRYTYRTVSSDETNPDLNGQTGTLEVSSYSGRNPLIKHGPLRVASNRRYFEHADGTPFFWLGDTWWMGLCGRLRWPEDFQRLAADRVEKGFTVIQIVAGLYPDMAPFDRRGANEAGFPWEIDYARINPHYFDMADLRIQYLVDSGLVPCIVGCWGYFLPLMGIAKMKQHWRYLVARWGAYPVIWCLAGEGSMPYYLSQTKSEDAAFQKRGWTEVGRYVRDIDPYHHPITIHPSASARDTVEDPSILDFDMLQTGHSDRASIPNTVKQLTGSLLKSPQMPALVGEVCYEGILEASRQEVQRFMFWTSMLNGAAGHTYGANGVWQVNTESQPFGASPHGRSYGDTPWQIAYRLPGSRHLSLGKKLLMRYPWWRFEPHPEWVEPHWNEKNYILPYAAGIPNEVRIVFLPPMWDPPRLKNLEPGVSYRAFYYNPSTGKEQEAVNVMPDTAGSWVPPIQPSFADWVIVLERKS
jgi:hypothetical protein